jgi:hypothetical protein
MNCSKIKNKLSAFMDKEVDGTSSRIVIEHLKDCSQCRDYLRDFKEIDTLVCGLPRNDPKPDFSRRVAKAAIGTSKMVDEKPVPLSSRLRFALERLSEAIFSPIPSGPGQSIRTLEEFSDHPPLSMSFVYLRLLEQPQQKMRILT